MNPLDRDPKTHDGKARKDSDQDRKKEKADLRAGRRFWPSRIAKWTRDFGMIALSAEPARVVAIPRLPAVRL